MGKIEKQKILYEGKVFPTINNGDIYVVEYLNAYQVKVRFLDTGGDTCCTLSMLKTGEVRDRFKPTVYGVGVIGNEVSRINGKLVKSYEVWSGMLERCYSRTLHEKYPTYDLYTVDKDWHYYANFKKWYDNQVGSNNRGWCLDKDVLFKGNKHYSEKTCCLIPHRINTLILSNSKRRGVYPVGVYLKQSSGRYAASISDNGTVHLGYYDTHDEAYYVYKQHKECLIKRVAEEWKDEIDTRVYNALMTWEVCNDFG